jgi:hypothetical protein
MNWLFPCQSLARRFGGEGLTLTGDYAKCLRYILGTWMKSSPLFEGKNGKSGLKMESIESIKEWWVETRAKRAIEKLEAHEFKAIFVKSKEEAVKEILKWIAPGQKVSAAGSVTIRELGVLDHLERMEVSLWDHWKPGLSEETILEYRKLQMSSDLFFGSVGAITMEGELVNIDGIGNRVNSINFGPGKVILVAGYNKIVENLQEAMKRIKNVAAPLNARRLNLDVPCAKLGRCIDCNSPNRICRIVVIQERKPSMTDMFIILVGEELGF